MRSMHVGARRVVQGVLGDAVLTATFLRYRCPTRATNQDKSPHQVWTGNKPLLANLKVFGCHAYVALPKQKCTKFDAQTVHCRFLDTWSTRKRIVFKRSRAVECWLVATQPSWKTSPTVGGDTNKKKWSWAFKKKLTRTKKNTPDRMSMKKKTLHGNKIQSPAVSDTRELIRWSKQWTFRFQSGRANGYCLKTC